ncbi:hypothetical protein ABZ891_17060 [Streptomyces sp. NPDC047023]|uniref:hypothetical protein n=1 Tax=Streptomyces sp. NPDC047023 TaxID=3155139 RepID=UPI0033D2AD5C
MTDPHPHPHPVRAPGVPAARDRLDRALDELAAAFRGAAARPDENACACHWGSAEELVLLKTPGGDLDRDLLQRAWYGTDWRDPGAVLRRILPQFARELTTGLDGYAWAVDRAGAAFAEAGWQEWPARQSGAVREFLHAWWAYALRVTGPGLLPAREVLTVCTEASGAIGPWLAVWEGTRHPVADHHLAETLDAWDWDLLREELPWRPWAAWPEEAEGAVRTELTAWIAEHAPARLRAAGAPEPLRHSARLLCLPAPTRHQAPHWPPNLT